LRPVRVSLPPRRLLLLLLPHRRQVRALRPLLLPLLPQRLREKELL
jgi:hypothetical protein